MTDSEAAAWTRGHAVGERELKAAEKGWQVERAELRAEVERLRAELARLVTPVPLLEREETGGCILWARDEDGWFESARIGATHWTPLPALKEPK
jgi:uncharacterized small protein (DUF1192 family)